ncbi:hypothetical protein VP01_1875g4 [Puccinia sorghi]|uniref:Uncharacterized protein n=1 Tax=Puccinia sorghi TaxID=27349 RepID=A0A0L6VDB0_9BASI|nr:hypothetical protein VP01_1875g4 [Puccinia sorghi]
MMGFKVDLCMHADIKVIDLDLDDPTNQDTSTSPSCLKYSWVWNHFKDSSDSSIAICQVMIRTSVSRV